MVEADLDITHPGLWIGFYKVGVEDPIFIQQSLTGFTPPCMRLHHLFLPLPIQCFTVGTQSRCLSEWENPNGDMVGLFHEVKIIHTTKGGKKTKREEIIFFYGKMATLSEDYDRWRWIEGYRFLNYTMKFGRDPNIIMTLGTTCAVDK